MFVSARGIVLEAAHFVPLFAASAIFTLANEIIYAESALLMRKVDFVTYSLPLKLARLVTPCVIFAASTACHRARSP